MLIKEGININSIESWTSHADTHLSDTLNRVYPAKFARGEWTFNDLEREESEIT